jgi:hypothetical protein
MVRLWTLAVLAAVAAPAAMADEAAVGCEVSGYEVILINGGPVALEPGTLVRWSVPFARNSGEVTLERSLEPGAFLMLPAALGSIFLTPQTPCEASR